MKKNKLNEKETVELELRIAEERLNELVNQNLGFFKKLWAEFRLSKSKAKYYEIYLRRKESLQRRYKLLR